MFVASEVVEIDEEGRGWLNNIVPLGLPGDGDSRGSFNKCRHRSRRWRLLWAVEEVRL